MNDIIADMNTSAPGLFPIFRSDLQGKILAIVLLNPEKEQRVSEIVEATDSNIATVLREINRLEDFGIFTERRSGRNRYISANTTHPLYTELRKIIEYSYGPQITLANLLETIDGVSEAYIYGSWAARQAGDPGYDPRDIDVLVVGNAEREKIYSVAREAEKAIGKEVNIRIVDRNIWNSSNDVFLNTIRSKPIIQILEDNRDEG